VTKKSHPPYSPDLASADFYMHPNAIGIEGMALLWCYCNGRAEKAFTE
jgi:hypothetical protein